MGTKAIGPSLLQRLGHCSIANANIADPAVY